MNGSLPRAPTAARSGALTSGPIRSCHYLNTAAIGRPLKKRATRAGLDPIEAARIFGHSLTVGAAQQLTPNAVQILPIIRAEWVARIQCGRQVQRIWRWICWGIDARRTTPRTPIIGLANEFRGGDPPSWQVTTTTLSK